MEQKTFSFAYKPLAEKCQEGNEPEFSAHINIWNLADRKSKPFIDFGLHIQNFRSVEAICFTAPFHIKKADIVDLSWKLKDKEIQLIFNDINYLYKQSDSYYSTYTDNSKSETLILPIKPNEKSDDLSDYINIEENNSETGRFQMYINIGKCPSLPQNVDNIYLRFRIKSIDSNRLLNVLKAKNNYLESAFTQRQLIDFKLNNVRTMDSYVHKKLISAQYILPSFTTIHLFIMVPTDFDISIWGDFSDCRQLEKDEWNNYLDNMMLSKSEILAYHWKKKSNKYKKVNEFAQLIKMEHKATNFKIILVYCAIVIVLGALGSALYSGITDLFSTSPHNSSIQESGINIIEEGSDINVN